MPTCPGCGATSPKSQKYCGECGSAHSDSGETRRRLVTTLFCDLVGSTELGERLDAERLHNILDRYFAAVRVTIQRHGGTVEKFIGDAVVATFGLPAAHEDDALRAVRAALDMREAIASLDAEIADPDVRLLVRVAIDCGVSFGDVAAATEGRIVGDAYNTAARLQAVAEPGDVVVSEAVRRMLRGHVVFDSLGAIELKGKANPVQAHRVLELHLAPPSGPRHPFSDENVPCGLSAGLFMPPSRATRVSSSPCSHIQALVSRVVSPRPLPGRSTIRRPSWWRTRRPMAMLLRLLPHRAVARGRPDGRAATPKKWQMRSASK